MGSGEKVKMPFAVVPLMLGFGLLLTGAILLLISLRPDMDATTTGWISELEQGQTTSHVTVCSYNAQFTVNGQTYVASSLDASNSNCDLQIGTPVVVEYNSSNPASNQIQAKYMPWVGGALAIVGILLLMLGGVLLLRTLRKQPR